LSLSLIETFVEALPSSKFQVNYKNWVLSCWYIW